MSVHWSFEIHYFEKTKMKNNYLKAIASDFEKYKILV